MRPVRSVALFATLFTTCALAHVGSPDIYLDGKAGPYQVFVTIRPPQVIPGVAELEVRCESAGVVQVRALPLQLSRTRADYPPTPDLLKQSSQDKQFFTGSLWLMADGSSQIRILVDGDKGAGVLSVPVPSIALTTRKMQWQLAVVLCVMGVLLVGGLVAIAGAAVREAKLNSGMAADPLRTRNGRIAMGIAFVIVAVVLFGGKTWWDSEAAVYQKRIYKPLNMKATFDSVQPGVLNLDLTDPGWMQPNPRGVLSRIFFVRKIDDLVPDHDHLMHLYAIREPGLDVIYHLHPALAASGKFRLSLPATPAGDYKLYADVVHDNGLPETLTTMLHLPDGISGAQGRPLSGDDATAVAKPVQAAQLLDSFTLPDGYKMVWVHDGSAMRARQGMAFHFRLLTPDGKAPEDMAFYMGMLGHAAFVKTDGSVFAHIHPNGTVSMAAFELAQAQAGQRMTDMPGMAGMPGMDLPNEVSFPYGFPSAGQYRIFVQMKHGQTVETGVFDARAE